jgi:hypothetical protein
MLLLAVGAVKLAALGQIKTGDKLTLTSPRHTFTVPTSVSFKTKLSTAEYDVRPKLKVFLVSELSVVREPLLVIEKTWR